MNLIGGWTNPSDTYISQIGSSPKVGVNTKIFETTIIVIHSIPPSLNSESPVSTTLHDLLPMADVDTPLIRSDSGFASQLKLQNGPF